MNKMIENIKNEFSEYVIMFERGTFCNVYYEDSYIISYLFDYKIKEINSELSCGFPRTSVNKVRTLLEEKNINYIILDRTHNYDEDDKMEFKDNKYGELCNKAYKYVTMKKRLENISRYILNNLEKENIVEIVQKCEEKLNETRKIYSNKSC